MSLRVRLVLLILVVVALAAVALSAVELETLVNLLTSDAIQYSGLTGQQVSALLLDHIDLYAANPEWQAQQTFDLGVPGSHVFEVRVTGLSNRAAVGFYVDVDALIVE